MASSEDNVGSASDLELDEVDFFHATRYKAMQGLYSTEDTHVSGESETEEVLPLDLSSNEEENHHDVSSEDDVDGAVSIKAWGKRKSAYYNQESDGEREGLEEELEEKEAIDMQHQLAALLAEGDFEADFSDNEEPSKTDETVDQTLSAKEKLLVMSHGHPELPNIIQGLKHSVESLMTSTLSVDYSSQKMFLETSVLLNLCHSLNSMYYLLLVAHGVPLTSHPIAKALLHLKKLICKIEVDKEFMVRGRSFGRLVSHRLGQSAYSSVLSRVEHPSDVTEDPLSFYNRVDTEKRCRKDKAGGTCDEDGELLEGKRAITYQMARNKGIGMATKRRSQNPRVKHKLKYKKALIKRKSQVLPVVKEINRYGGESTGIKANLARSTKISL